jgi:hypothetical protein
MRVGNFKRKTQTLDYVQFCDLHLPERGSILRLGARNYQFQQGLALSPKPLADQRRKSKAPSLEQGTTKNNWNHLVDFLTKLASSSSLVRFQNLCRNRDRF